MMKFPTLDRWKKNVLIAAVGSVLVIKTVLFFVGSDSRHSIVVRKTASLEEEDREAIKNFKMLQKSRRKIMKEACQQIMGDPKKRRLYEEFTATRNEATFVEDVSPFRVVSSSNLIWCKVPKAGSTTWSNLLEYLIHSVDKGSQKTPQNRGAIVNLHSSLRKDTENQKDFYEKALEDLRKNLLERAPDSPWSVIVVRDPWARTKSAYRGKVVEQSEYYRALYGPEFYRDGKPVAFSDFLHTLLSYNASSVSSRRKGFPADRALPVVSGNEHFLPMYGMCDPCNHRYDFVIKMENLKEETSLLLQHLGMPPLSQLGNLNPSKAKKSKSSRKEVSDEVDAATRAEFQKIYGMDKNLFGYN